MVRRIFVEKKQGFQVGADQLKQEFLRVLGIESGSVREFLRYDIEGISEEDFARAKQTIFSEPPVDAVYEETLPRLEGAKTVVIEYLPGQYDQRADSAVQCLQLLTMKEPAVIRCAKVIAVAGVSDTAFLAVKKYLINPVESREGSTEKPETLAQENPPAEKTPIIDAFLKMSDEELDQYHAEFGFAMSKKDLAFVRQYFLEEGRAPSLTELKVIDTYWSDHCRHTTFSTELDSIEIESENPHVAAAYRIYREIFGKIYADRPDKYPCLMDLATIAVKQLKSEGKLAGLDESDEINACSVQVQVDVDGKDEDWLIMFKNETHNHPTEIEPFGGAATCLGGAIRDPLSGRTYVYQAMRVSGASDPTVPVSETIPGKLPQRVITTTAAAGFSAYGNQIGLATGIVHEMYHPRYQAKRLETGYVIAGAPKKNVIRKTPQKGDIVLLVGGETGRDGCGGATGSSKAHTAQSVETCGAEVQKGNPTTERKIQRLFRNPVCANLIIRCNDFGAGGVSVAIGELAESLDIYLDQVPKKYDGLSATELAISESQERMAVVIHAQDKKAFEICAAEENLRVTEVAQITDSGRMRMFSGGETVVDLSRAFLDTNGVKQHARAVIAKDTADYIGRAHESIESLIQEGRYQEALRKELSRLNVCSQKGLGERFDSSIGAATVITPFGGKNLLTPAQVMAAKPPVDGVTDTATVSTFACYPHLSEASPFMGAVYALTASVSKLIASGVKLDTVYLTLQEYFKKLGADPLRWGEPVAAVLGAFYAQLGLGLGAIGGKDSMSGSFEELDVPPTLISFAMGVAKAPGLITNTFGKLANVYRIPMPKDRYQMPDFKALLNLYDALSQAIEKRQVYAAFVSEEGGIAAGIVKSCLGNGLGFRFEQFKADYFAPNFGDIVILADSPQGLQAEYIGTLTDSGLIEGLDRPLSIEEAAEAFTATLEKVFPSVASAEGKAENISYDVPFEKKTVKIAKPRVLIPVFPGTNCEYDTAKAFERAGGVADIFVLKNRTPEEIEDSVAALIKHIRNAQILAFPGGFSGGDEPDGSGKFIATTFRNPKVKEAVEALLYQRDGLALGICNGFQALIKLGLVPYGQIVPQTQESPTLTFNKISRHVSTMVNTRIASNRSPWLSKTKVGEIYSVAVSHGEGRFIASDSALQTLIQNGQVATQYVDPAGNATMRSPYNPNGSVMAIEGILSPDGRVMGKMGHTERAGKDLYINYDGNFDFKLFEGGIEYFD